MDIDNDSQAGSDNTVSHGKNEYTDNDVIFLDDIKDLPIATNPLRTDKLVSVVCHAGKLQVEINTVVHTIKANDILMSLPNDMVSNTMSSSDFAGTILCLSPKAVTHLFGESNSPYGMLALSKNPIIKASDKSMEMLKMYSHALHAKMEMGQTPFRKQIIYSLIKASLCELMENAKADPPPSPSGLRQSEILFRQFVDLLSGREVKPRTVTWYAEQMCITPKHLSTVCKRVSGKTALCWINQYMAMDIRHLLRDTDKPIKEIANLLKFPNTSFFGTYCKKRFGKTPLEYRKHLRAETNGNGKD